MKDKPKKEKKPVIDRTPEMAGRIPELNETEAKKLLRHIRYMTTRGRKRADRLRFEHAHTVSQLQKYRQIEREAVAHLKQIQLAELQK